MKRLRRILLNAAAALSLALCVAACSLWAASYARPRQWTTGAHPGVKWEIRSARGWLSVERYEVLYWPAFGNRDLWSARDRYEPGDENAAGFYTFRDHGSVRRRLPDEEGPRPARPAAGPASPTRPWYYRARVGVAYRLLGLATAAAPVLWLWARRASGRRRHTEAHLCRACGYDLRATPDRCPECGAVPAATTAAAETPPGGSRP